MQPGEENQEPTLQQQPPVGSVQAPVSPQVVTGGQEPVGTAQSTTPAGTPDQTLPVPNRQLNVGQQASGTPQAAKADFGEELISWQASEFVDHQKNMLWYGALVLGAIIACVAVFILTGHDILATVVVGIAALAFGVLAGKKPRTLTYTLYQTSISVGQKNYSYDDFRTFSVSQERGLNSIVLQPVKRFLPPLTIYFAQEDGEIIFDILASYIPHEEQKQDALERFMKRIRF